MLYTPFVLLGLQSPFFYSKSLFGLAALQMLSRHTWRAAATLDVTELEHLRLIQRS